MSTTQAYSRAQMVLLWSHCSRSAEGNVCFHFGLLSFTVWQSHLSKGCILKALQKLWLRSSKNCTTVLLGNQLRLIRTLHKPHVHFTQKHTYQLWPQQNSHQLHLYPNLYLCLRQHKIKRKHFWVFWFSATRTELSGSALGSLPCSSSAEGSWL